MALGYGRTGTNNFATADYIVDGDGLQKGATHTTIQGAIDDASAGESIAVRPGTYTENITLKSDISLNALGQSNDAGDVAIVGKVSAGTAANASVVGFRMTDNADVIIEDTGSTSGTIVFERCSISGDGSHNVINCTNTNRNFTYNRNIITSPSGAKILNSSGGNFQFNYCKFSAGDSTISTQSAGSCAFDHSIGCFPIAQTGTATFTATFSTFSTTNQIAVDLDGGNGIIQSCEFRTGSATCITVDSSLTISGSQLNTSNNTVISGTGSITYDSLDSMQGSPPSISTTTTSPQSIMTGQVSFDDGSNYLDNYEEGSYTPTTYGSSTAGTGTYVFQAGSYTRVGNIVRITANVRTTAHTGSGTVRISLPFTTANVSNLRCHGSAVHYNGTNYIPYVCTSLPNTNYVQIQATNASYGGGLSISGGDRFYLITITIQV